MFVAGVELDLALLRVHRHAVITLALITFGGPMALGSIVGLSLGWNTPAAVLLAGSARGRLGISAGRWLRRLDRAAGRGGLGSAGVLRAVRAPSCRAVRVPPARNRPRVRYLLALTSFLAAATLADSFGIEGIVGAFFAGLGLNRLVPNEGPLMDRIAATVVGFNIGLFGQSVVNAVLVLILASIIVGTLIVERVKNLVPAPTAGDASFGKRILVALEDPRQARLGFAIAERVAAADSGVVRGLLRSSPAEAREREHALSELRTAGFELGLDTDPALLVHSSLAEGVINPSPRRSPRWC